MDIIQPLPRRFIQAWLLCLIILAAFLRVHGGNDYAYSPDEAMLINMASGRDIQEVRHFSLYESHPPLGNFLRHAWMSISSDSAWMRSESLLFGLMLILLYYHIGKLLAGDFTGLCCALIVAFSRGAITQSYVVRNYSLFLILISAGFYLYLSWRRTHKIFALTGYSVLGCLACATHFAALFTVVCINLCETVSMIRRRAAKHEWQLWVRANIPIIMTAAILYSIWLPILNGLKVYFDTASLSWRLRFSVFLEYPLSIPFYIFPSMASAIFLTCGLLIFAVLYRRELYKNYGFQLISSMLAVSVALGMFLFITNMYTPVGGRHCLWIFPFFVPVVGWLIAHACLNGVKYLRKIQSFSWVAAIALCLIPAGWMLYEPTARFSDTSEYAMNYKEFNSVTAFFRTLTSSDLIILERDDAGMFENIYPYLENAEHGHSRIVTSPYVGTNIIFDAVYRRLYKEDMFLRAIASMEKLEVFSRADRLVFFYSLWPHSLVAQLMSCPSLDKQVIFFPSKFSQTISTERDIHRAQAVIMIVQKKAFLDQLLATKGKARACLYAKE